MSDVYIDRDGFEYKKGCMGCGNNVNKKKSINLGGRNSEVDVTYCEGLRGFLPDNGQFYDYYRNTSDIVNSRSPRWTKSGVF